MGRREHSALVSHLHIHRVGIYVLFRIKTEIIEPEYSCLCLCFLGILHRRLLCWSAIIYCFLSRPGNCCPRSVLTQRSRVRVNARV
jgi:hypothetical protein